MTISSTSERRADIVEEKNGEEFVGHDASFDFYSLVIHRHYLPVIIA